MPADARNRPDTRPAWKRDPGQYVAVAVCLLIAAGFGSLWIFPLDWIG